MPLASHVPTIWRGLVATSAALAPSAGTYVNPVLDADFPDPAVIHAPDGFYYAYATQTLRDGEWINIQVARSADLVHWQHLGDALPGQARLGARNAGLLGAVRAPRRRRYLMYYSATHDACHDPERGHCLAVATSDSPAGPFVDMGMPLLLGVGFEFIDPMVVRRPGDAASVCSIGGRASSRSRCRSWAPTGCRSRRAASRSTSSGPIRSKGAFPRLVEAAWVIRHDDFYYLFYSGDNCCGPDAEYGVMVARSTRADRAVRDARRSARRAAQPDAVQERALACAGPQFDRHRQGRARRGSSITRST